MQTSDDDLREYDEEYFEQEDMKASLENDGVYGDISDDELRELMDRRKQRYTEGYNRPVRDTRTINTKVMVVSLVLLILYYVVAFILNVSGVISNLVMFCMMAPVTLAMVIIYLVYRNKHQD